MKLARIKAFNLFINTTYDDLLLKILKRTRKHPVNDLSYTLSQKKLDKLDNKLFDSMENSQATLVYNIYGHLQKAGPAFTEEDILETLVEFQKDIEKNPKNRLFQELSANSLLFIGCAYDDWLFRFFIRIIANERFAEQLRDRFQFVSDDLLNNKKDPFCDLPRFLKNYHTEVFYSCGGKEFVDMLFEKMKEKYPDDIIKESEFPWAAFISFEGTDRLSALKLAKNLETDGVNVWVDKREIRIGNNVDNAIIKAIEDCLVFIPLISENSKKVELKEGEEKYHIKEWNWAYLLYKRSNKKNREIIPVKIEDTDWIYDGFKKHFFCHVPGGERKEDYEKLRNKLLEIQRKMFD